MLYTTSLIYFIVKSILLKIRNSNGLLLPYEHNYKLATAIYDKLRYYQESVRELHRKDFQDIHTISSIIPHNSQYHSTGIKFDKGLFVVRSYYDDVIDHLRLAISLDEKIRIGELELVITRIQDTLKPEFNKGKVNFKTISPVLVRDQADRKTFRTHLDDVPENLAHSMVWSYDSITSNQAGTPSVNITNLKRKTVRVSNDGSTLAAVLLTGSIIGDSELLQFSYFKGLGSKTGLGLGCWEVL